MRHPKDYHFGIIAGKTRRSGRHRMNQRTSSLKTSSKIASSRSASKPGYWSLRLLCRSLTRTLEIYGQRVIFSCTSSSKKKKKNEHARRSETLKKLRRNRPKLPVAQKQDLQGGASRKSKSQKSLEEHELCQWSLPRATNERRNESSNRTSPEIAIEMI